MKMKDYHIDVFWSEDDAYYVADIPDLVSCSALGEFPQQAVEQVLLAMQAWLEAAAEAAKPDPTPDLSGVDLTGGWRLGSNVRALEHQLSNVIGAYETEVEA